MAEAPSRGRRAALAVVVLVTVILAVAGLVLAGVQGRSGQAWPIIVAPVFAVVGGVVLYRRPGHRIGWLMCAAGLALAALATATTYAQRALITAPGSLPGGEIAAYAMMWLPLVVIGLLIALLPQIFPDGRALSPRWRPGVWAAWVYLILGTLTNVADDQVVEGLGSFRNPYPVRAIASLLPTGYLISVACLAIAVVAGVAGLVVRWRRSRGDERQQLKWFGVAVLPLLIPLVLHEAFSGFSEVAFAVLLPLVPLAIGVAILRYRLYDLDIVLNRAVVYVTLSTAIGLIYLALVAAAQAVIGEGRGLAVQVGATVVAAAAFQPLRTRVQWAVDRLFYGERSRPYEVLARLGLLLEQTPAPETVLPSVVDTVAAALRVPHVAVQLREGDGWVIAAAHGEPAGEPESFPMVYSDEVVGRLLVGRRGADDGFTHADRRLLGDLARHTGVAAHAVQLTEALRRSRAALVNAREEERRRLRRDLHDGLGPALAGVTLGLHAAAAHVSRDPRRAVALIEELERQIEEAVTDIRRLVYNLRPPALDELGLAHAVRREAARLEGDGVELSIVVDIPTDGVGTLPAAVEVAAYRIVAEALTNVARHARAHHCEVRLRRSGNGPLEVEIVDDGVGLDGRPAGVGLAAMRERAEELGGACRVTSDGGTRVLARLPITEAS